MSKGISIRVEMNPFPGKGRNYTGWRFNDFRVIGYHGRDWAGNRFWVCQCDRCGWIGVKRQSLLRTTPGSKKRCGHWGTSGSEVTIVTYEATGERVPQDMTD
jgi:hypothetical protein